MSRGPPILWALKIMLMLMALAIGVVMVIYIFGPLGGKMEDMGDNVSASLGVQGNQSVLSAKEVHTDEDTNADLYTIVIAFPVIAMVLLYIWYYQRKHGCTPAEAIRRELRGGPRRRYQ